MFKVADLLKVALYITVSTGPLAVPLHASSIECESTVNSAGAAEATLIHDHLLKGLPLNAIEIGQFTAGPAAKHIQAINAAYVNFIVNDARSVFANLAEQLLESAPKNDSRGTDLRLHKYKAYLLGQRFGSVFYAWVESLTINGEARFIDIEKVAKKIDVFLAKMATNADIATLLNLIERTSEVVNGKTADLSAPARIRTRVYLNAMRESRALRELLMGRLGLIDLNTKTGSFALPDGFILNLFWRLTLGRHNSALHADQWREKMVASRKALGDILLYRNTEDEKFWERIVIAILAVEPFEISAEDLRTNFKEFLHARIRSLADAWLKEQLATRASVRQAKGSPVVQNQQVGVAKARAPAKEKVKTRPGKAAALAATTQPTEEPRPVRELREALKARQLDDLITAVNHPYFSQNSMSLLDLQDLLRQAAKSEVLVTSKLNASQFDITTLVAQLDNRDIDVVVGSALCLIEFLESAVAPLQQHARLRLLKALDEYARNFERWSFRIRSVLLPLALTLPTATSLVQEEELRLIKILDSFIKKGALIKTADMIRFAAMVHQLKSPEAAELAWKKLKQMLTLKPGLPEPEEVARIAEHVGALEKIADLQTQAVLLAVFHEVVQGFQTDTVRARLMELMTQFPSEHFFAAVLAAVVESSHVYRYSSANVAASKLDSLYNPALKNIEKFDDVVRDLIVRMEQLIADFDGNIFADDLDAEQSQQASKIHSYKEAISIAIAMRYELEQGRMPIDVSGDSTYGCDIVSINQRTGDLRYIEAKSRVLPWSSLIVSIHQLDTATVKQASGHDYFLYLTEIDSASLTTNLRLFKNPNAKSFSGKDFLPEENINKLRLRRESVELLEVWP